MLFLLPDAASSRARRRTLQARQGSTAAMTKTRLRRGSSRAPSRAERGRGRRAWLRARRRPRPLRPGCEPRTAARRRAGSTRSRNRAATAPPSVRPKTRTAAATSRPATDDDRRDVARKEATTDCGRSSRPVPQACSSSTRVPQKSFGCRNSTGLPWAPILGSPAPRMRAPPRTSGRGRPGCRPPRSRRGGCRRPGSSPGTWRSANRSPRGSRSSILVFGRFTNTTVTPCSGMGCGRGDLGPEGIPVDARGGLEIAAPRWRHG